VPRWPLALVVFAVLALPATAQASSATPYFFHDAGASFGLRLAAPPPGFWGGEYDVSNECPAMPTVCGQVTIYTSAAYPEDEQANQDVANFLDGALHGPELGTVTILRVTSDQIGQLCGSSDALACYDPQTGTIATPADDSGAVTAKSALLHEFGHHVANARRNPPWTAIDWGPKRWATYENVCAQTRAQKMFPGAEQNINRYRLNPGEGWAEAYRVLNEQRLNLPPFDWQAVSRIFYPDATALKLVQEDVVDPWLKRTTSSISGRLAAKRSRTYRVSTPLDGVITVTGPAGLRLAVLGPSSTLNAGARTVNAEICGRRTLRVRVTAKRAERYALRVTEP